MTERAILTWGEVYSLVGKIVEDWRAFAGNLDQCRVYGVPRGGVHVAQALVLMGIRLGHDKFLLTDDICKADLIVDDIIDTGRTKEAYQGSLPTPFFALIDKTKNNHPYKNQWVVFPWELRERQGPTANVTRMIQAIGDDPDREGLKETPARVVASWNHLFSGYKVDPRSVIKVFEDDSSDEMVILKDIEFYSTCEHHMLPFHGKAHIAYIPRGKVIGVSKLARLLEVYTRRLQIQERICQQVTKALQDYLQPKGAACILEAQHFCMTCRGVEKQNSVMTTSSLVGVFKSDMDVRTEFLHMIRG